MPPFSGLEARAPPLNYKRYPVFKSKPTMSIL